MSGFPVVIAENGLGIPVISVEANAPGLTIAANGFGMPIVIVEKNGIPAIIQGLYDSSATALFDRFTTPPTTAQKGLINELIKTLKTAGVWSKLDALYLLAAADNQAARRNWIADQYNITAVASPTFTADLGYQGDGVAGHLRTGFNPSTAASPKFALNSASMGVWLRTSATGVARMAMGGNTAAYATMEISVTNILVCQLNAANGASVTVNGAAGQPGLWASNRSASNAIKALKNGGAKNTDVDASSSVPNIEIFVGARSNNGPASNFSADQMSASFIGSSLSDAEHLALYSAVNTYLTAVGAV